MFLIVKTRVMKTIALCKKYIVYGVNQKYFHFLGPMERCLKYDAYSHAMFRCLEKVDSTRADLGQTDLVCKDVIQPD